MTATAGDPRHPEAPVIRVEGLTKEFHVTKQRPFFVHSLVRGLLGVPTKAALCRALADVGFEVRAGESVAVVGRNGAGKSTLLSLIVGTLLPTRGTIQVRGRVGALLELGVGFHPRLTGRENVYLNASLHGLSNRDIDGRYEGIVDFAELEEFMDAPLGTYSSGMKLRLGFAVAASLDPDIMIVDEALAVGDEKFQEKCFARVKEMIGTGTTLLLVSHDPREVARLCSRALWLRGGRLVMDGPSAEVLARYTDFLRESGPFAAPPAS